MARSTLTTEIETMPSEPETDPLQAAFHAKVKDLLRRIDDRAPTPEECEAIERRKQEYARRQETKRRADLFKNFIGDRGKRYQNCRFANYEIDCDAQRLAVEKLWSILSLEEIPNLVLGGPRGAGKDHLLVALAFELIKRRSVSVTWYSGMDLFGEIRDRIERREPERTLIDRLGSVNVLALSDPVPVAGALTDHQANMLYRIVDRRYSNLKSTWITINVTGREEFDKKLGAATADRLRDGAIGVECNWPSYRRAK